MAWWQWLLLGIVVNFACGLLAQGYCRADFVVRVRNGKIMKNQQEDCCNVFILTGLLFMGFFGLVLAVYNYYQAPKNLRWRWWRPYFILPKDVAE